MQPLYTIESPDGTLVFFYKQKRMDEGYRDSVHSYDELKFIRLLEGSGIWRIGHKEYAVTAGDILLMSRADIRQLQHVEQAPLTIEQVDFLPAFLAPLQDVANFFVCRPEDFENLLPRDTVVIQKMDDLVEEILNDRPYKQQAVRSKLTELVIATARLLHATPTPHNGAERRQDTVEQAMNYIRTHLSESLSLEKLAKRFYLSPAYFSRLFRRYSGMSFQDYLAQVRVKEVLSLLDSQPINVLDAALQCGFSSSSGFYRTFRHVTGTTPKHFK